MIQTQQTEYLSVAETAKLVMIALAKGFPGVKFSVKSRSYSGGASIDVKWTDGPQQKDVEAVAKKYEGSDFDGSIDLKYSHSSYLRPNGEVLTHFDPGTEGSKGIYPSLDNRALASVMPADVKIVHFGADYIFCNRAVSDWDRKKAEAVAWIYKHCDLIGNTGNPDIDQFGNYRVDDLARNMAHRWNDGEDLEKIFDRAWNR